MNSEQPDTGERRNRILVREFKPAEAGWSPDVNVAPSNRVLVILPTIASEVLLQRYAARRFTWLRLWGELLALRGRGVGDEFKVIVDHPLPERDAPKLFLCTIAQGDDRDDGYLKGIDRLMHLVSALTREVGYGFEPVLHETVTFQLMNWKAPEEAQQIMRVRDIDLVISNGRVTAILTPIGYALEKTPFRVRLGPHPGYITTHIEIPTYEGDLAGNLPVQSDAPVREFEKLVGAALTKHAPEITMDHLHAITLLYNAALTTTALPIGFLLLWQVLESASDIRPSGEQLINEAVWKDVEPSLKKAGIDEQGLRRVRGAVSRLRTKGQDLVIAELLKEYADPKPSIEELLSKVRAFRKTRGNISHPKDLNYKQMPEMMEQYAELRTYVTAIIRKFGGPDPAA